MKFTKMQGAGNDYVLLESDDTARDWGKAAMTLCNRHFGVGADSLLLVLPSRKADFRMRIFDTDGSEAEACGNGIRCLVKYVYEKKMVSPTADRVMVETAAGVRTVRLFKEGERLVRIQANMGKPAFRPDEVPVVLKPGEGSKVSAKNMLSYPVAVDGTELRLNLVSMGNPHAVHFWQQPVSDFPLSRLGPRVENLPVFPNRVNFEVARVINRHQIEARVWERGVGETMACGSGACAITVAAQLLGYSDRKVDIELPGGALGVEWNGDGELLLSGPAEIVFTGEWPEEV